MTPAEQARAFAAMLLAGVCMGVFYDLLGPMRRVKGLCAAADLLFGLLGFGVMRSGYMLLPVRRAAWCCMARQWAQFCGGLRRFFETRWGTEKKNIKLSRFQQEIDKSRRILNILYTLLGGRTVA